MLGKTGIKFSGALALLAMLGLSSADAGLKQLEIKGGTSLGAYWVDVDNVGSDSLLRLDTDLDFKMKFSQDVSARLDLELDGGRAGNQAIASYSAGSAPVSDVGDRYNFGIDQAYFKMNDFLFRNFSLTLGKQNMFYSLRDNKSFSWAWADPIAMVGNYSTRDLDVKAYFAKLGDSSDLNPSNGTNDNDQELYGVYGEYWLNDDSLIIGYLNFRMNDSLSTATATNQNIVHFGIGLDYFIGESLELYGELAGQSIDSASTDLATGAITNQDGSPLQITLGFEYAFSDFDMKPTVNLEYYQQDGASGTDAGWQSVAGGAAGAENQSIYVEGTGADAAIRDTNFGVGVVNHGGTGTGYNVIRLNGWLSPSKSTKVGLGIHIFGNEETVTNDDLGTEIDLTASWKYSQDVAFRAGAFTYEGSPTGAAGDTEVMGFTVSSKLSF